MMNNIDCEPIDELDDVIVQSEAWYEVWALGYDENGVITDAELYLNEFSDPDQAVAYAKEVTLADVVHIAAEEKYEDETPSISVISLEVETVVEDEDGEGTMNVGTIFRRDLIVNEEPEEIIELTTADYKIDSFGSMEVLGKVLGDRELGEKVKFLFVDTTEKSVLTYEIIFRSTASEHPYYVCDLIL